MRPPDAEALRVQRAVARDGEDRQQRRRRRRARLRRSTRRAGPASDRSGWAARARPLEPRAALPRAAAGGAVARSHWAGEDSNLRLSGYEPAALTAELPARHVPKASAPGRRAVRAARPARARA